MLQVLEVLVRKSLAQRRAGQVPPLFATGVRYRRIPPPERWQSALYTFERGYGDCDQLCVWRAADLRLEGRPANVVIKYVRPGLYHAQVVSTYQPGQRDIIQVDGKRALYDPSRVLGMKGAA